MVQVQSSGRVFGEGSLTESEAFCTFAHNILTSHGKQLGVSRRQWTDTCAGDLGAVPGPNIPCLQAPDVLGNQKSVPANSVMHA